MATPTDGDDQKLLQLWNNFKASYEELGYRRASYEYFAQWLHKAAPDLSEMVPNEIQRRLHAYRKRLRQRKSSR